MRTLPFTSSLLLALALVAAGCIKEEPLVDAALDEEPEPPTADEAPVEPTPASPTSQPPPSSPPPPAATTPPPQEEQAPPPPPPPPRVDVFAWNGTLTGVGASASTPGPAVCCAQVAPVGENADVAFEVPSGLRGVVVELVWADPQFDLDLLVTAADYDATPSPPEPYTGHRWHAAAGTPGQPEGHVRLVLTDAEALAITGEWGAHATAKGPANEVAFTLVVSLFFDEPPASDYTATAAG